MHADHCPQRRAAAGRLRIFLAVPLGLALLTGGCPVANDPAGGAEEARLPATTPAATGQRPVVLGTQAGITMSPTGGLVEGGTAVTLVSEGGGFDERTSVQFGDVAAEDVQVFNNFVLVATAPPGDPGVIDVKLAVPGLTAYANHVIRAGSYEYFVMPPDDGTDSDGDGLTDFAELTGWETWIDGFGFGLGTDTFGNILRYNVVSDPHQADTDGDGVDDHTEYLNKMDPRRADSDGDGLDDLEELSRWLTSPVSLDTDGDARGPGGDLAPNSSLFDGAELITERLVGTGVAPFFSEFVEGTGYNQALEIYNPTDHDIDLGAENYSLQVISPAGDFTEIPLSGVIPTLGTFAIADARADDDLRFAATTFTELNIDGNSTILLFSPLTGPTDVIGSLAGPTAAGLSERDVESLGSPAGVSNLSAARWQSFVSTSRGFLNHVDVRLANASPLQFTNVTLELRFGAGPNGAILATSSATVAPNTTAYVNFPFENVRTSPGQVLTLVLRTDDPNANVNAGYSTGDAYPDGMNDVAADADYLFVTWVRSYAGWGDDRVSTFDHTLRRKPRVCAGNPSDDAPFDPRDEWIALPADSFDGLLSHTTNCPKYRIIRGGTSPTLDDTDGDGASDYDEFDNPLRTSQIADLPQLRIDVDDLIDMRLLVTYSDSVGTSTSFGATLTESETTSRGFSDTAGLESTTTLNTHISAEVKVALPPSVSLGAEFEIGGSLAESRAFQTSTESARSAERAFSEERSNSRERTEEVSAGSISLGLIVENTGNVTFDFTGLAIAVRQFVPDPAAATPQNPRPGAYRTVATLTPAVDNVTLAAGERSPVLQVSNDNINAELIRQFLANPTTLLIDAAGYELLDAEGRNFSFITSARSRTATLVIDYGDAQTPRERYQVATNVDRGPDGAYVGIPLTRALEQSIGLPRLDCADPTEIGDYGYVLERQRSMGEGACQGSGPLSLTHVRGYGPSTVPNSFWVLVKHAADPQANQNGPLAQGFDDIMLLPGDEVICYLSRDDDGDGLFLQEEIAYGTSDQLADTDGDGLNDPDEVAGWDVAVSGEPVKRVTSDPRLADTDLDGLSDLDESLAGTDPRDVDTDVDSLSDVTDPNPLVPALRLYVDNARSSDGDGLSWETAYKNLAPALLNALARNSGLGSYEIEDQVSEIWVAQGVYRPNLGNVGPQGRQSYFLLLPNVKIFGGFQAGALKLGERNPDPLTNSTILTGDLNLNDSGLLPDISTTHPSRQDNAYTVVRANASVVSTNAETLLDGFTVRSGNANGGGDFSQVGGVRLDTPARLRNLVIAYNTSGLGGAGALVRATPVGAAPVVTIDGCLFTQNLGSSFATDNGGGLVVGTDATVTIRDCEFSDNVGDQGAGVRVEPNGAVLIERTVFNRNTARASGGAIFNQGVANITSARFRNNAAGSGGALVCSGPTTITNSELWANSASNKASAILVGADATALTNVTIAGNVVTGTCNPATPNAALLVDNAQASVFNTIIWGNAGPCTGSVEAWQVTAANGGLLDVRSCLIQGLSNFAGAANLSSDPLFRDANIGDLRLSAGSPAIDTGGFVLDTDPFAADFQPLVPFDVLGNPRVADGDADGSAAIDRGAFEFNGAN